MNNIIDFNQPIFTFDWEVDEREEFFKVAFKETTLVAKQGSQIEYYNLACGFDIETTSFYRLVENPNITFDYSRKKFYEHMEIEKISLTYVWCLCINGVVIRGRLWGFFYDLMVSISDYLNLNFNKRLIIYVHNLSYEYQFMRYLWGWDVENSFHMDIRKPLYVIAETFIEFRCSYKLSNYSLDTVAKNLLFHELEKLYGNLDYSKIRTPDTIIEPEEWEYIYNDVRIVVAYIQEKIILDGDISRVPYTKTSYSRRNTLLDTMYKDGKRSKRNFEYQKLIRNLTIEDEQEFKTLERAFSGGFTHANFRYVNKVLNNVASLDFTSSYPYVIVSEMFPMSKGVRIQPKSNDDFQNILTNYLSVFTVEFFNISPLLFQDNPISRHKCFVAEKVVENNGRVVYADRIMLTITNIDYKIIKDFYKWDRMRIYDMYVYSKGYLPKEFIVSILKAYKDKTELKGVKGKELEYMSSKEDINSRYGMMVTNPFKPNVYDDEITGEWKINEIENFEKELNRYNNSDNRFITYSWGVFVTAYARSNLFSGIKALDFDYVYSDTDSIKLLNYENHKKYFQDYNKSVKSKLKLVSEFYDIPFEMFRPVTKNGEYKMLGLWDFEGSYPFFKTLGAKRYMSYDGEEYELTCSGLSKTKGAEYIKLKASGDINRGFDYFKDGMYIEPEYSGKMVHTYIDERKKGSVVDYTGKIYYFDEYSGLHLEPAEFELSQSKEYIEFLKRGIEYERAKK